MTDYQFLKTDQIKSNLFGEIAQAYQIAFAGEPWFEVSKCPSSERRCPGGFSPLAIGATCVTCTQKPTEPAYEAGELIAKWQNLSREVDARWYLEFAKTPTGKKLALASLAWRTNAEQLGELRYADNPEMQIWLRERFGNQPLVYRDETFKTGVRETGNMLNFTTYIPEFNRAMSADLQISRTINPRMLRACRRFGAKATIFAGQTADETRKNLATTDENVPDRRDFIVLNFREEMNRERQRRIRERELSGNGGYLWGH